jgi:tyrosyl-tRNA synthetase
MWLEVTGLTNGEIELFTEQVRSQGVVSKAYEKAREFFMSESVSIIDFLSVNKLVTSKGEAKRLVRQGGVQIRRPFCRTLKRVTLGDNVNFGDLLKVGKLRWVANY